MQIEWYKSPIESFQNFKINQLFSFKDTNTDYAYFVFFSALTFALGTLLVCVSIYFYGLPRQDTTSIQQVETASKERPSGV